MTTRLPLLVELGTEELPVKALPGLAQAFLDGVIAVRGVDAVMNKAIALELAGPQGRGAFRLAEGISFK